MSDIDQFKANFDKWLAELVKDGEPEEGLNEIRQAVRDSWGDKELRMLWIDFVAKKANC